MNRLFVFLLVSLLLLPITARAVRVSGLYEAVVPVSDQSTQQRNAAIRSALTQVMVKLTGNRNAVSIYGVDELLKRSDQFVQQYEYRTENDRESGKPVTRLWVRFDPAVIDNGMREYNIPVWSQERPSTLVWLVIKDDLGQRFAGLDEDSRYFAVLQEQAQARGISFITPLYDLQDAAAIKSSDVLGGLDGPITLASERYLPDAILAGAVVALGPNLWEGRWISIVQGQAVRWTNSGDSIEIVLSEGMDGQADNLAANFAGHQGYVSESRVEINVTDIRNFSQYAQTLSYLESLNFVSSVDVRSIDSDQVVYVLSTRGNEQTLSQALALGRVLQPAAAPGVYRFVQ